MKQSQARESRGIFIKKHCKTKRYKYKQQNKLQSIETEIILLYSWMWNQLVEYVYLHSKTILSQLKFEFECQQGRHIWLTYIPER